MCVDDSSVFFSIESEEGNTFSSAYRTTWKYYFASIISYIFIFIHAYSLCTESNKVAV